MLFFISFCLIHDYLDSFNYFKFFSFYLNSCYILRRVFNHHKRCSSTKLPWSTDHIPFESTWPLSLIRHKKDNMTAMRRRKLHFNWWLVGLLCLTSMLDYQHVVSWGDTLHLPSNWNINYRLFSAYRRIWMWLFIATFMISLLLQT